MTIWDALGFVAAESLLQARHARTTRNGVLAHAEQLAVLALRRAFFAVILCR
jgi:hypothetical protein